MTYFLFSYSCHSACQLRRVSTSCLHMLTFWERNSLIHLFIHSCIHQSSQQSWPSSGSWGSAINKDPSLVATARVYPLDTLFRITLLIPPGARHGAGCCPMTDDSWELPLAKRSYVTQGNTPSLVHSASNDWLLWGYKDPAPFVSIQDSQKH